MPNSTPSDAPADEDTGSATSAAKPAKSGNGGPSLGLGGIKSLLEAMPAAIGVLRGGTLILVNSAFAYAFGFRSPGELIESGGLATILPGGAADLRECLAEGKAEEIPALSRSRRRLAVNFVATALDTGADLKLLRLIDPSDIESELTGPDQNQPGSVADDEPQTAGDDLEERAPSSEVPKTSSELPETFSELPETFSEPPKTSSEPPKTLRAIATPLDNVGANDNAATDAGDVLFQGPAGQSHLHMSSPQRSSSEQPVTEPEPAQQTPLDASQASAPSLEGRPEADAQARNREAAARRLDFLAKVSHEVRTPLNSIIGFAELMLHERFGPIGNARYKGYTEDIHQSGLYALSLLNDLLDISKIEAGKFELDFMSVDTAEVVESCVASLQPLAKRTRILLRTSFADDLPLVLADPRRLRQIMLNLLTNAIKFTPEGGQVIVSGTLIAGQLRLRVHDSGVGMTEADIAYAMQPFHQLDTAPRHQSGTGLGLPLTKALADAVHAKLKLTSEPGVGTSADVTFPEDRLLKR